MFEVPEKSMWFEYDRKISFQIDNDNKILKCKKNINSSIYTITKDLPDDYGELLKVLNRFVNLPDEFWKPIE